MLFKNKIYLKSRPKELHIVQQRTTKLTESTTLGFKIKNEISTNTAYKTKQTKLSLNLRFYNTLYKLYINLTCYPFTRMGQRHQVSLAATTS